MTWIEALLVLLAGIMVGAGGMFVHLVHLSRLRQAERARLRQRIAREANRWEDE